MTGYPKPSAIGGTLIRKVIALFKSQDFVLPFAAQDRIFVAVSGGVDSMVLAHLLATYGRNVVPKQALVLVHLDHGWRAASALEERELVERFAQSLGVAFIHEALPKPTDLQSRNLEEDARLKRQSVFSSLVEGELLTAQPEKRAFILTAHHQTDAVESIFWRFLRGEFHEYGNGILFQDSHCIRPFLQVTKEEILEYARSEGVPFLEDPTNSESRYFRGFLRTKVFPLLEEHFPHVKKTLATYLTNGKTNTIESEPALTLAVQTVIGTSLNRAQRKALHELAKNMDSNAKISLPGGMQIRRTSNGFFIEKSIENSDASDRRNP